MDHTTQQNAAMVEQSSAAAGNLAAEAQKLRELIAKFDLGMESVQATSAYQPTERVATLGKTYLTPAHPPSLSDNGHSMDTWRLQSSTSFLPAALAGSGVSIA